MIYNSKTLSDDLNRAKLGINLLSQNLDLLTQAQDTDEISALIQIQFKNRIIFNQFNLPPQNSGLNSKLISLILYSANYFDMILQQPFVVTGLIRTQSEQDKIYGSLVSYQKAPWKSVHQYGRGCDVRIRNIQTALINKFVEHINRNFPYDENRSTALIERDHIHMQVKG